MSTVSKPSTSHSSTLHPSRHHTPSPTFHSTHTSHPNNTTSLQEDALLIAASGLGNGPTTQGVSFADASSQLLAETRATFARLEKEAEELEDTYHQIHHKNNLRPDSKLFGHTNEKVNDNFPLAIKYQGPPGEHVADPTPPSLVQYTSHVPVTTQSSILSPVKATVSEPNSYIVTSLPQTHQSTIVTPPPTATVWTASTAMTAKASPPLVPSNVNIPTVYDHTIRQPFASLTPPDKSATEQPLLLNQSPVLLTSSSHPSTAVPTVGFTVTQGKSMSREEWSTTRNVVNSTISTNAKTTDIAISLGAHPHSSVAPSTNKVPPELTQPTPGISAQPLAPTLRTKPSPPKISLDELWKSSQHQRQPDDDEPTTFPESKKKYLELDNGTQQSEEIGREGKEKQRAKHELEALPLQDKLKEEETSTHQPDPPLWYSNGSDKLDNQSPPPAHLRTNLGHCQGGLDKEQIHSAEENDELDPVMLKYMELVKQRRENKTSQVYLLKLKPSFTLSILKCMCNLLQWNPSFQTHIGHG